MARLSSAPFLVKGALVAVGQPIPVPKIIPFQYNPASLSRNLSVNFAEGDDAKKGDKTRIKGAPKETIKAEIILDATDNLAEGAELEAEMGIFPRLAALESLLYGNSEIVLANQVMKLAGVTSIMPVKLPFILFVWGWKRIVPVSLKTLSVTEESFDARLTPLRAKVALDMSVLTYDDFGPRHPGSIIYMAHHLAKETMAKMGEVRDVAAFVDDIGSGEAKSLLW